MDKSNIISFPEDWQRKNSVMIDRAVIKNVLVLEDDANRIEWFRKRLSPYISSVTYTDNAPMCIDLLSKNKYDLIFLDHDLGGEIFVDSDKKNTGSEVARFMASDYNTLNKDTEVIIHSLNPSGADNMASLIKNANKIPIIGMTFEYCEV